MKNRYFLIETDSELTCADVLATFTNKKEAIKACAEKRRVRKAANGLRLSEGSRERSANKYFITVTDEFVEATGYSGGFHKVPQVAIIY
jgi:hypothetical protein